MKKTSEKIILVNPQDKEIGMIEKHLGHQYGMLHRAFSVLIFRKRNGNLETLLQQRSKKKYHGGGLWTNTCCSHPRKGETLSEAAHKRLKNEMGITVKLKKVGKFHYIAKMDKGMTENEIDHVFIGIYNDDTIPTNPAEVQDYEWVNVKKLTKQLVRFPKKYSPWFKQALELALPHVK